MFTNGDYKKASFIYVFAQKNKCLKSNIPS